jgi:hypothetical protein
MAPAAAVRFAGRTGAEVVAALVFAALYVGAWTWMGADPADREIWRRLTSRTPPGAVQEVA